MRINVFIACCLAVIACKKENREDSIWANAVVLHTQDINCGYPTLNFSEDSMMVRQFTGQPSQTFVVRGLPSSLNEQNKKLRVQLVKQKPEESFMCLTLGPNYPAIKVVNAQSR